MAPPTGTIDELSLAEHVCLALVAQGATHGWQVGTLLAPDGEIGHIWSLSRPLTYRALDQLTERQLVRRSGTAQGAGRARQLLRATARGRRLQEAWLAAPVDHLRSVRTELLLKLALRTRAGDDVVPLLAAQRDAFDGRIEALTAGAATDLVGLWRRESARAVRRFLDTALAGPLDAPERPRPSVPLSARNQLDAHVTAVVRGDVLCAVTASLGEGRTLTAAITRDAVDELDLAPGDAVVVVVKATDVMIAKP